jgi:hypothetical protein
MEDKMTKKHYCKWCGKGFSDIGSLTINICSRNPIRGNRHELYEGAEKEKYVCKYCGKTSSTIEGLVINTCIRHPKKGSNHEPAL